MEFLEAVQGVKAAANVSELCQSHMYKMFSNLALGQVWAYQMLDSWSKVPMSMLDGNVIDFGNYDECLGIKVNEPWGTFVGQHCTAIFNLPLSWLTKAKENDTKYGYSMCVPSTCTAADIKSYFTKKFKLNFIISPELCHTRESGEPYDGADWIAIIFLILLGLMCFIGTAHNLIVRKPERRNKMLMVFSYYTNGDKLLGTEPTAEPVDVFPAIRVISLMLMAMTQTYVLSAVFPQINARKVADYTKDGRRFFIFAGFYAVDVLYMLNAMFLCHATLKTLNLGRHLKLTLFYLQGFLRITPVLLFIILLEATIIPRLGDGLMWDLKIRGMKQTCQSYWWSSLLYIQNYVNVRNMCVESSWFAAVYMQLYWLSPFIILALHRRSRYGMWLIIGSCFLGSMLSFQQIYSNGIIPHALYKANNQDNSFNYQTHMRVVPWFMGLGFGCFLYKTTDWRKELADGTARLNKITVICGWLLSLIASVLMFSWANSLHQNTNNYSPSEAAAYTMLCPIVWSYVIFWIIFACDSGYGGVLNTILRWPVFQPVDRLRLCIYLLFPEVCTMMLAIQNLPSFYDDRYVISRYIEAMFVTMILSLVICLTVEVPFVQLGRILLHKFSDSKDQASEKSPRDNKIEECNLLLANLKAPALHED